MSEIETIGSRQQGIYASFAADNPDFLRVTTARVASYWNEYYRYEYPNLADYPGTALLSAMMSAPRTTQPETETQEHPPAGITGRTLMRLVVRSNVPS